MSQNEPYIVLRLSGSAAERGRTFATIAAARKYAKRSNYNAIGQKKRGHAGITIVERIGK